MDTQVHRSIGTDESMDMCMTMGLHPLLVSESLFLPIDVLCSTQYLHHV